jgi:hypothetical protein
MSQLLNAALVILYSVFILSTFSANRCRRHGACGAGRRACYYGAVCAVAACFRIDGRYTDRLIRAVSHDASRTHGACD